MLSVKHCLAMNAVYYKDKIWQLLGISDDISIWSVLRSRLPCTLPACLEERCRIRMNLFSQQLYCPFGLPKIQIMKYLISRDFLSFSFVTELLALSIPTVRLIPDGTRHNLSWTLFNICWLGQQQQNMLLISEAASFSGATLRFHVQWHEKRSTFCSQAPWTRLWWNTTLSRFFLSLRTASWYPGLPANKTKTPFPVSHSNFWKHFTAKWLRQLAWE